MPLIATSIHNTFHPCIHTAMHTNRPHPPTQPLPPPHPALSIQISDLYATSSHPSLPHPIHPQEDHCWSLVTLIQQTFSANKPAPDGLPYESVQLQLRLLHEGCLDTISSCHIRVSCRTAPASGTSVPVDATSAAGTAGMHAQAGTCLCAVYIHTPAAALAGSSTGNRRSHVPMLDQPHPRRPCNHQPQPPPAVPLTAMYAPPASSSSSPPPCPAPQAAHPVEGVKTPPPSRTTTIHPKHPPSGNVPLHAPSPSHRTISSASQGHQPCWGDVSTTTGPATTTTTTTGPVTTTGPATTMGPATTSMPPPAMPDPGVKAHTASVVDFKPLPSDQLPAGLAGITMLHLAKPASLAGQGCEVPAFDPMAQELQAALEEVLDWDVAAAGMWVEHAGCSGLQPCEGEAEPGSPVTLLGNRKRGYEDGRWRGFC